MATSRPRPTDEAQESAGGLEDDATPGSSELTETDPLNGHGNDGESVERKGARTMKGGLDPVEMGRRSGVVRRAGGAKDSDAPMTLADAEQAVMRKLKAAKPAELERLLSSLERLRRLRSTGEGESTDPTTPVEEWSDVELQRVRARLLRMASRLETRAASVTSIAARVYEEEGAPPRDGTPALAEVSRVPSREPEARDSDVREQPGHYTDPPPPRQAPTQISDIS